MIAQTQLKKPSNWQDFEKLCKLLWGEIWACEDTIKQHGRQGQNQHGVDVFSYVEKYGGYCGIQCKGKDDYTNAQLTEGEIDAEIEKALSFEPKLKLLVFATTANKDAKIEGYIRNKDVDNRAKGLFAVDIASWEDIVDQLERYRATVNWYVNNCQFKDATDVRVTFDGEEEIAISPEYVRTTVRYEYRELTQFQRSWQNQLKDFVIPKIGTSMMPWNRPRQIDKRWCELNIRIENTGKTVIKTPKLIVSFRPEDIVRIDDDFCYCNAFGINEAAKAQIQTVMLKLISDAEVDYESWNKAGSVKRSQVIQRIFQDYPILSRAVNQEAVIEWIDEQINASLKELRKIVAQNKAE